MIYAVISYILYPLIWLLSRAFSTPGGPVLVIQTAKIGDMICSTPVFREIKRAFPDRRLSVMAAPSSAGLLRCNPRVDEIIEFDRKRYGGISGKLAFASKIRKKGFGAAVILLPNSENIVIPLWALIPVRVCVYPDFAGATMKALMSLNTSVERHSAERTSIETYIGALRHLGITGCSTDKEVYSCPGASEKARAFLRDGRYVGMVLGTANPLKDWGSGRMKELAGLILSRTPYSVVFLGGPQDRAAASGIIDGLGEKARVLNSCGSFSLLEMPEVIKRLSLVVGVDTGLIYMADALGVALIVIAGPCVMDQRPTGARSVIVRNTASKCPPCVSIFKTPYECRMEHRECVTGITAEEVMHRVSEMLRTGQAL
ncbi:MAG TPA: glycosyltransferase family 9 protein [Thermodesulfobacteriota bacterium]